MEWLRWYHGTCSDSKWPLIARKSGQSIGAVVAVWAALLEHASQDADRGSVTEFDPEEFDVLFGFDDGVTLAILTAMKDKGLIVDGCIAAWGRRQVQDENAAERKRLQREREKLEKERFALEQLRHELSQKNEENQNMSQNVTPCHSVSQRVTKSHLEQNRTEKNREDKNIKNAICAERLSTSAPEPPEDILEEPPVEFIPLPGMQGEFPVSQILAEELQRAFPGVNVPAELAKARAWCVTNPTKRKTAKGIPRFLNAWMERAQNSGRSAPGSGPYVSPAQRRLEANIEAARDFVGVA